MRRVLWGAALAAGVVMLASGDAAAVPLVHRGFMARAGLGVGFLSMSERFGSLDITVSGATLAGHLAIGGHVIPNLSVHATFWNGVAFGPSAKIAGASSVITGTASTNTSLSQNAFGVGVTYAMPGVDVFFTGSLGVGLLSLTTVRGSTATTANTDPGFALTLGVGKQWGINPDFGLGLMGQFNFQTNSETVGSTSYAISTVGGSLLFSVTYH